MVCAGPAVYERTDTAYGDEEMSDIAEHFAEIRRLKAMLDEEIQTFADEHHKGCECWFDYEWANFLLTFPVEEQEAAISKLEEKYNGLNIKENENGNCS